MSSESDAKKTKPVVDEPADLDDCMVCFKALANNDDDRTVVTLRCRHQFHLDCIGSAFNKKNKMECPCCEQIEKGQWLIVNRVDLSSRDMPLPPLPPPPPPQFPVYTPYARKRAINQTLLRSNPLPPPPRPVYTSYARQGAIDQNLSRSNPLAPLPPPPPPVYTSYARQGNWRVIGSSGGEGGESSCEGSDCGGC